MAPVGLAYSGAQSWHPSRGHLHRFYQVAGVSVPFSRVKVSRICWEQGGSTGLCRPFPWTEDHPFPPTSESEAPSPKPVLGSKAFRAP